MLAIAIGEAREHCARRNASVVSSGFSDVGDVEVGYVCVTLDEGETRLRPGRWSSLLEKRRYLQTISLPPAKVESTCLHHIVDTFRSKALRPHADRAKSYNKIDRHTLAELRRPLDDHM